MSKKKIILAKDIMERIKTIKPSAPIKDVKRKLKTTEDTLIVIDGRGKVHGEIDEFNLIKMLVPEELLDEKEIVGLMGAGYDQAFFAKKAKDLMNVHEVTATPETTVEELAYLMYKEEVRAIPILKNKKIIGVVHVRNLIGTLCK